MIQAILFDLWNVLGTKPSLSSKLARHFSIAADARYLRRYEHAIQLSEHKDLPSLALDFCVIFNIARNEDNMEFIMQALELGIDESRVMPGMPELLEELHKNYRLGILSNTSNFESVAPIRWGIAPYFDAAVYSWQVGSAKPDAKIFEAALQALDVEAADCLFIDDTLENVEAARVFGMQAIHFQGMEDLKKKLAELP